MVLVTGGTGFLGSYIIKHLVEKGYSVRAIRREKAVLPSYIPKEILEKVDWIQGDILDVLSLEEAMEGVDQVIHAAAIVSFLKADRKKMYQVNVEGTANVVNIALEKNVKRLVYISSVAALGRTAHGGSVNEDSKWEDNKVNTHYARSKYKAELEVWRGSGEGLNTIILNPGTILGYGDWNSSSCAIFRNVYNEFKWYTPGINGFVDVDDVARATLLLMESNINDQRYIINGDNWHFKKLQETMADNFQKKKPSKQTTLTLIAMAWRMEKLKSFFNGHRPLLTRESARVAHSKTYFENAKLLALLRVFHSLPCRKALKKLVKNTLRPCPGHRNCNHRQHDMYLYV